MIVLSVTVTASLASVCVRTSTRPLTMARSAEVGDDHLSTTLMPFDVLIKHVNC